MNRQTTRHRHPLEEQALEARFALRVTARLSDKALEPSHDVAERLRVAREQAIARARVARLAAAGATAVVVDGGGAAALGRGPSEGGRWFKLASLVPLAVLIAGLLTIQYWHTRSQIAAAADVDAALLADDVPPSAYADPGFAEFLKSPPPPRD